MEISKERAIEVLSNLKHGLSPTCMFDEQGHDLRESYDAALQMAIEALTEPSVGYGCGVCGIMEEGEDGELPSGWHKQCRPDNTYYFLCPKCPAKVDDDYLITDENRQNAIDEITGQLATDKFDEYETKALRDYANRLLDEAMGYTRDELQESVAAYSDGFQDARGG